MTDWTIRPARPDDAPCLAVLAMQVFLDTYALEGVNPSIVQHVLDAFTPAHFAVFITDPGQSLLVAEQDDHLIGFVQTALRASHELAPHGVTAEVDRLYVQQPFHGRQIGKALLDAAESVARADGVDWLWLTTWFRNQRAIGFYAKQGYADLGQTWYEIEGELHENRFLAKDLRPTIPA